MQVSHVRVVDLTDEQLARCRELSFGDEGYMNDDLDRILEDENCWRYRYSHAILLSVNNGIVGWGLVEPMYRRRRYTAQFFVDPAHRRKGYGTRLLEEANKYCKRPFCFLDDENEDFFMKYKNMCTDFEELSN